MVSINVSIMTKFRIKDSNEGRVPVLSMTSPGFKQMKLSNTKSREISPNTVYAKHSQMTLEDRL